MHSQITTKRGDDGTTDTLSGNSLSKAHPLIECLGTLDTVRAQTALIRLEITRSALPGHPAIDAFLLWLLHTYFLLGASLSGQRKKLSSTAHHGISATHVQRLEEAQAWLEERTPLPRVFIVSATNPLAAQIDVATTFVRTLERRLVEVKESTPNSVSAPSLAFVNRLSDYFFLLARYAEEGHHHTTKSPFEAPTG